MWLSVLCLYFAHVYSYDVCQLVRTMSVQEKIGQLFVVATTADFNQPDQSLATQLAQCPYNMDHRYIQHLIETYHIGGIIFLFKSTPHVQRELTKKFQALSTIPLLICQDGEWGLDMRLYDVLRYPRAMTLGALPTTELIYDVGKEIARQYRLLGVHMNLAPVVDCNTNPANPIIHDRSFGSDAQHVAQCGVALMRGLQDGGVAACAKHFPGHGDTAVDSHIGLPVVAHSIDRLQAVELYPFKELIRNGVAGVMTAHVMVPALDATAPASLSQHIVHDLLQTHLGFEGVVISDGLGMGALSCYQQPGERELQAFLAGNDILLCPLDVPHAVQRIERAIEQGIVSIEYLDRKVEKILTLKQQYGVTKQFPLVFDSLHNQLHTKAATALQKELFAQAVTLVRDDIQNIPLSATTSHVCAFQIGGDVQSRFLTGLQNEQVACHYYHKDVLRVDEALKQCICYETIIIGIAGMHKNVSTAYGISDGTLKFLDALHDAGKKIIVVLFGTPYSLRYMERAATVIVAYEDVPETQQAVVEIIYAQRSPTGKLPVTVL